VKAAAIAFGFAVAAANVSAQELQSISVRADNDAFNFWKPAYQRPDEEYTSGVRGSLVYFGPAWWEHALHRDALQCQHTDAPCATHSYSIGQDIYTGKLVPGDTIRIPGTRPNAGWLYLMESSRIAKAAHLDETSITLGVTGPPALGEQMQLAFHSIAPDFNRPTNWTVQIPAEPGVIVAYDRTQRVFVVNEGGAIGADVEPHAGASLGNILTEARAGLRVRAGFNLQHPWLAVAETDAPVVTFFGDATLHAIGRNEFLAGALFTSSPHVDERPLVTDYQLGFTIRVQRLTLTYSLDQISSEYTTRANGHAWSRLGVEWRIER